MKLELKDYQSATVNEMIEEITEATRRFKRRGRLTAISLSSPTGSGKTIIATSVIESSFNGTDVIEANPDITVLWVTDQPELNEQTKRKMIQTSSHIKSSQLIMVSHSLDQKTLDSGRVYFVNISKLGKGATRFNEKGDNRRYPLWDIIRNTIAKLGGDFILIIDEAHRGTKKSNKGTITSRLIEGAGDSVPVPTVIGISATPKRFVIAMSEDPHRMTVPITVDVEEVKRSGLIKDKIVVRHPDVPTAEDMSLLSEAVRELKRFDEHWEKYAEEQSEPRVIPILVIQVPPGCSDDFYDKILTKLKSEWNILEGKAIGHSMESHSTLKIKDKGIRYIRPPDIQDDRQIRVALFKQALHTGWDCPRAEVMISFASANDETYVAQTIGRMVRTPLARSISTDDFLNSVSLYLPKFNAEAVKKVIENLDTDDSNITSTIQVNSVSLMKNASILDEVWDTISSLPTYSRASKYHRDEVSRLNTMAMLLIGAGLETDSLDIAKKVIVGSLTNHATSSADKLSELEASVRRVELGKFEASILGDNNQKTTTESISRGLEDINQHFSMAKRLLPDSSAMDYWNALCEEEE